MLSKLVCQAPLFSWPWHQHQWQESPALWTCWTQCSCQWRLLQSVQQETWWWWGSGSFVEETITWTVYKMYVMISEIIKQSSLSENIPGISCSFLVYFAVNQLILADSNVRETIHKCQTGWLVIFCSSNISRWYTLAN